MNSSIFINNFFWKFLERWGAQGVTLVVGIVLARILDPDVYGVIALVTVFTSILQVFIDSGLGTALIQKKDVDDLDYSSVFWFNLVICVILYFFLFLIAPLIASFYSRPELIPVIRVLGLTLVISGVKNIQQAYVSRNLMFKKFFYATLSGTVGAAAVGILMAYKGFGVWALVAQYLFNAAVDTIVLWISVRWRPKLKFSFDRFAVLFSYGWKILLSSLIDTFYLELRALIIGKFYSSEDLAFYTKGAQFPKYGVDNINSAMNSVLLPVLAKKQDDLLEIKKAAKRVIRISSFIICPMMVGLCAVAERFVTALLTDKWLPCVIYLRIICFNYILQPLQTTNLNVIKALGRADLHLKLEIVKKTIAIIIVIVSSFFGVKMIAVGSVIYSVIASILNSFPNRKLIHYSYAEQIKDVFPFLWMSAIMGVTVYALNYVRLPAFGGLILQMIVGITVYGGISALMRIDALGQCAAVIKGILKR